MKPVTMDLRFDILDKVAASYKSLVDKLVHLIHHLISSLEQCHLCFMEVIHKTKKMIKTKQMRTTKKMKNKKEEKYKEGEKDKEEQKEKKRKTKNRIKAKKRSNKTKNWRKTKMVRINKTEFHPHIYFYINLAVAN